jgi:hypothetical protein
MDIYVDGLSAGWEDESWWCVTCDFAATDQVYEGTHAISVTLQTNGALSLGRDPAFDSSPYYWLEFYVRGSSSADHQHLQTWFNKTDGTALRVRPVDDCRYIEAGTIDAGAWKQVFIPLGDLNAGDAFLSRLTIQTWGPTAFWVDEIRLIGAAWQVYLPAVLRN